MSFIRKVNAAFAVVGGYVLLLLSFMIVIEVIGRKLLGFSLQGVDEIGAYVVAITGTFGFAYALVERTHTRIDIILGHVTPTVRNLLNLLAYVLVSGTAVFMTYHAYHVAMQSFRFGSRATTPLDTPLWIPQSLWLAGLVVFAVTSLAVLVHLLFLHIRDPKRGFQLYGPRSVQDEIDYEITHAEARKSRTETSRQSNDGESS